MESPMFKMLCCRVDMLAWLNEINHFGKERFVTDVLNAIVININDISLEEWIELCKYIKCKCERL